MVAGVGRSASSVSAAALYQRPGDHLASPPAQGTRSARTRRARRRIACPRLQRRGRSAGDAQARWCRPPHSYKRGVATSVGTCPTRMAQARQPRRAGPDVPGPAEPGSIPRSPSVQNARPAAPPWLPPPIRVGAGQQVWRPSSAAGRRLPRRAAGCRGSLGQGDGAPPPSGRPDTGGPPTIVSGRQGRATGSHRRAGRRDTESGGCSVPTGGPGRGGPGRRAGLQATCRGVRGSAERSRPSAAAERARRYAPGGAAPGTSRSLAPTAAISMAKRTCGRGGRE
jgi:hypothetical protein